MQIIFDNNPDKAVEEIYSLVKTALQHKVFNINHVEALSEMFTELVQRSKEETGG